MEISWFGHACFRLKNRNCTIITDPFDKTYGLPMPRVRADVVTVSIDHPFHNNISSVKGEPKVLNVPGEFEISMVYFTGIALFPAQISGCKSDDRERRNVIYLIESDGLTICHLGCLSHVPTQIQVEDLSDVDILIIPVGNAEGLNAGQAAEVISMIEPLIVIPMQYRIPGVEMKLDPLTKFQKEMGLPKLEAVEVFKASSASLPEETQVIELLPRQA